MKSQSTSAGSTGHNDISPKITFEEVYTLFCNLIYEMMKPEQYNTDILIKCKEIIELKLDGLDIAEHSNILNSEEKFTFNKFYELIDQYYTKMKKVDEYSRYMGISSRKLTACCFKITGNSAKALIEERLIRESTHSLLYSSRPVKSIAVSLGFSDPFQFSKFFKKHTSVSPKKFRIEFKSV